MCHSILFQYILKILVNVIRFLQYFLQICYKSQCPLPSALLYLRGPSSVGKARIFLLNAPCQVPYFTRGARPVHLDRQMYSFFFKVMPLAACSWFSAATGSFLCLNEFLPGVLDHRIHCRRGSHVGTWGSKGVVFYFFPGKDTFSQKLSKKE